ncbi:uncharacterized protein LOC106943691 [Poecilia latipinna]|uniref:uncharacterized protein LOC106943691 n=1 Tax=Poecilia latipinna TaxID=48699 RepID=UPI00072E64A8|nr:PREDICTED: uncharacterized protein LOC106943691 [Poecilia latipinna]
MAFHQAQYILREFSTPSIRSNHNSVLSQENSSVNNITSNGVNKSKGSCKTYIDTCHTSDKGKGRGSSAVANSPTPRSQSSKKGSTTTFQPQKKHKVSLYYTKHKPSSAAAAAAAMDEEHEDLTPDSLTPDSCNNNHPAFISEPEKKIPAGFQEDLQGDMEHSMSAAVMFPVEIATRFPNDATLAPGPRPGLLLCSLVERSCCERYTEKIDSEKRDISELEFGEEAKEQKKKTLNPESGTAVGNNKGKKNRRMTENVSR